MLFGISNGLACDLDSFTWLLPGTLVDHQTNLDDPPPSLQPRYRAFTTTTRRSVPLPCISTLPLAVPAAWGSPFRRQRQHASRAITARGSHVSCQRLDRARATSVRATARAVNRYPPGSSRGNNWTPVTIAVATLTTLQQWFTHVRLPGPHLTHHVRLFRGAHHPGSFTGATHGGLQPPPAGRLWRACLHHRHNTATISAIFYIATSSRARGAPSSAKRSNATAGNSRSSHMSNA